MKPCFGKVMLFGEATSVCLGGGGLSVWVCPLSFGLAQFPIPRHPEALQGFTDQCLFTTMTLIIFILLSFVLPQPDLLFIVPVYHCCIVSINAVFSNSDLLGSVSIFLCLSFFLTLYLSLYLFLISVSLLTPSPLHPHHSHSLFKTRSIGLLIWWSCLAATEAFWHRHSSPSNTPVMASAPSSC